MTGHVLYLLHFVPPFKGVTHYLGITRAGREAQRWREHEEGDGASLTAAALKTGSLAHVAAVWQDKTFIDERAWKRAGHLKNRCPFCTPALAQGAPVAIATLRWRGLAASAFAGVGFAASAHRRH